MGCGAVCQDIKYFPETDGALSKSSDEKGRSRLRLAAAVLVGCYHAEHDDDETSEGSGPEGDRKNTFPTAQRGKGRGGWMILFQLGFDHYVPIEKIKVILPYESTRVKKDIIALREEAGTGKLIDATKHKPIKTVVVLDDGTFILCTYTAETLAKRYKETQGGNI
jgi:regulator of extracellular matrix RemA (YlzA/DUF370 family)